MIKVFMPSTFLGHVNRGYESFTKECFDALSKESALDITLFKGGGSSYEKEVTLRNPLLNADKLSNFLAKITLTDKNYVQQFVFFLSFLPYVFRDKPDVIFVSERRIGTLLWKWRRLSKQKYKVLLSNSGPTPPPFPHADHVQQVAPSHLKTALNAGVPYASQTLLPLGFDIAPTLQILTPFEREKLREQLGLPIKRPIVISVGAIKTRKRMDYVIQEVAALPEPRPYLVLLGQQEDATTKVIDLGNNLLGAEHFLIKTVTSSEVINYYKAVDIFVLAALTEGFGRVYIEALSQGLPCLAHDYEVSRYALDNEGYFADFTLSGSLTNLISKVLAESQDDSKQHRRHQSAYERLSWDELRSRYVEMIQTTALR